MTRDKDDIILSDNPLSKEQESTLASIFDMIIPASSDGRMPSATEVNIFGYIREDRSEQVPLISRGLATLNEWSESRHSQGFASLSASDRQTLVDEIQTTAPGFIQSLVTSTVSCYYQDDRVLKALGMRPGPPFPEGYEVEPGDLSLLDPVRRRGKLYRE